MHNETSCIRSVFLFVNSVFRALENTKSGGFDSQEMPHLVSLFFDMMKMKCSPVPNVFRNEVEDFCFVENEVTCLKLLFTYVSEIKNPLM